jgi:hypothetical protein
MIKAMSVSGREEVIALKVISVDQLGLPESVSLTTHSRSRRRAAEKSADQR